MPPRVARLAGLGALGASAGLAVLFLLFVFLTRPSPYSGMDWTQRTLAWMGVAGVVLALIAVHVLLGRQLLTLAKGERSRP